MKVQAKGDLGLLMFKTTTIPKIIIGEKVICGQGRHACKRVFFSEVRKMKRSIPQTRYVKGSDPWETATLFNELLIELAELNPTYERDGDSFWVYYKIEVVEEERSEGVDTTSTSNAHCEDCPYVMRDLNRYGNIDARRKWASCARTGERVHIESRACEIYDTLMERRKK